MSVSWIDTGNGKASAIVEDPENVGNYKSCCVRPWPDGRWRAEVNGAFRGWHASRRAAKAAAIAFAQAQISGAE